ncbi:GNAT family N-acetyltransferase [Desulfobulbus rhabdoformis]|uniref:GNAT family N-acetyltransferase n=1 Tax=Desulfobulbus rhabdoformis TaxID=34032 RepID=UPI001965D1EF|nr:GNAT family N-acetyltransferase [Desulfobulbus rhabdoformis]MBM9616859.1 GNAT family N-acetyltransferase [Desulfobulbus rhabdoformis]
MIRAAEISDAESLTRLSFESKGHWGYPASFFEAWSKELTITHEYINQNDVVVSEVDGTLVGYYSIVELKDNLDFSGIIIKKGFWLEHMFVEPQAIGKGIGRQLFNHLRQKCLKRGIVELGILSDPHAKGFYEKMGCIYLREYPSTIKHRTTPFLVLKL